ncbi:MAG: hypothetical protein HKN14_14370 [Marinicaulis sp.]|nr:hypothetical protein [Marinicaulis sp.]NNE42092.1 hypothetical protein [Marinicaulis sp.]NNL89275.1 hypothetical protein [Marinicaulis sp.]
MTNAYDVVMDPNQNPLAELPKAQKFQLMSYLSLMWTTIFCVGFGFWAFYGQLVVLHILVALGAVYTGFTFRNSKRQSHRDKFKRDEDGTARYDDLWGAP